MVGHVIRVVRPAERPGVLESPDALTARREAEEWAKRVSRPTKKSAAAQRAFHPRPFVKGPEVLQALDRVFNHKCAFCESTAHPDSSDVTWYRPPSSATGLEGDTSLPHYAWLSVDWDNLYLSCANCESARGRRFPVEGARARIGARGAPLHDERPLLLDPCRDEPDEHLVFTDEGLVSSDTSRGRATIGVLDLNRLTLVEGRKAAVDEIRVSWLAAPDEALLADAVEFAAARRQAARRLIEEQATVGAEPPPAADALPEIEETDDHVVVGGKRLLKRSRDQERSTRNAAEEDRTVQAAYSLNDRATDSQYFTTARYVERVEVRNFRPIEHLDLTVPAGADTARWLMLVGENAAGKSSLLTAVALALMGQEARDTLQLDARRFVRSGARRGEVRVWLSGIDEPVTLGFNRREAGFSGTVEPKVLLLGYGATRLLPRRPSSASTPGAIADFDNLFDPFVPLVDATAWLLSAPEERFTAAARGLRSLFDMEDDDTLTRHPSKGEVRCRKRAIGANVRIEELSDGYQSVLALAVDIMAILFNRWSDLSAAEGVVVLDELGAHLHPRWRMRIVPRLRALFPRVQFLVTTHDPLCLRGLRNGEAVVLERLDDEDRTVVARTDLPPIAGMRVDQLLTSEYFGLRSTIDPEIEAQFDEYFRLKALRTRTPEEEARLQELVPVLEPLRVIGETPAERLALEAAERHLSEYRATKGPLEASQVRESALNELQAIWAETAPERFS